MQCMLGNISSCAVDTLHFSCSSQKMFNLDIDISKKKFHPSIQHNGGRKMGVKNPKNINPKVVLDPNTILKNHYFVTEVTWTYLGSEGFGSEGFFERYPKVTISYIKSTLRYQKKIYTRHMPHMGACFWK